MVWDNLKVCATQMSFLQLNVLCCNTLAVFLDVVGATFLLKRGESGLTIISQYCENLTNTRHNPNVKRKAFPYQHLA